LPYGKVKAIAAKQLPGEIAANAKPADVAKKLQLFSRRELVSHAQTDEGIKPFERSGSRDSERARPLKTELLKVDRSIDRKRKIEFLVPVPSAAKQVECRG
jgi:hypothetical protein